MIRLQKYMADCGVASRRACESIIESGRVLVNGSPASLGQSVNPDKDKVTLDGKLLSMQKKHIVVMLYKPRGVVSTSEDEKGRKTVQEYVKDLPYRLYNVGRLDLNSEGLLLLTNDGELATSSCIPDTVCPKLIVSSAMELFLPEKSLCSLTVSNWKMD